MSSKKNIVFISSWYPTELHPTNGNFVERHARAAALTNNVFVIHAISDPRQISNYRIDDSTVNGIRTIIIYYPKVKTNLPFLRQYLQHKNYIKFHLIALNEIIKDSVNIDLIHGNVLFPCGLVALKIEKKYQIPFVMTEHWTGYLDYRNLYDKSTLLRKKLTKKIAKKAKTILPVSQDLANSMYRRGLKGHYEIVPNVVDMELFKVTAAKSPFTFLHISTLKDDHKNITGILRAFSKAKFTHSASLLIVGDGDPKPHQIKARELGLGDEVCIQGEKSMQEIAKLLSESSALVLFSNWENLPCVIIEALASGRPIISSNVGGISEHLNNNHGILIEKQNEEQLSLAMEQMSAGKFQYNSEALRNYALDNFSIEAVNTKLDSIYNKIIRSNW